MKMHFVIKRFDPQRETGAHWREYDLEAAPARELDPGPERDAAVGDAFIIIEA